MSKKRKRETKTAELEVPHVNGHSTGDSETTNKRQAPERPIDELEGQAAEEELLIAQPTRYGEQPLDDDAASELDRDEPTRGPDALAADALDELDDDQATRTRDRAPLREAEDGDPHERFDFGPPSETQGEALEEPPDPGSADAASPRLQSIVESLLFAADRPLNLRQLADLVEEPELERIRAAVLGIEQSWRERGVQLHEVAGGFQFRTHPANATWVQKLLQQKPVRLSRALLETLAIVSYRQPITRPEIDEIRGVDSGGTLKTLMDRSLVRILGKREEVGRPLLYGTTKEFLEFFSLRDLKDLPTLREYHELSEEHQAQVAALEGAAPEGSIVPAGEDEQEPLETLPRLSRLEISAPKEEDAHELEEIDRLIRTAGSSIATDSDLPGHDPSAEVTAEERAVTSRFAVPSIDTGDFEERQHTRTFGDPLPEPVSTPDSEFEGDESTRLRGDHLDAELIEKRDPDKEPS